MALPCKISLLVDYAHEPQSIRQVLETLFEWKKKKIFDRIVHVVSCDARGRDDWKKPIMGKLSLDYADFSVVTTENYEANDDPQEILHLLTKEYPKELELTDFADRKKQILMGKKFWKQTNRQQALLESLEIAKTLAEIDKEQTNLDLPRIVVCATGHGHETILLVQGQKTYWDEVRGWQDLFNKWQSSYE